MTTLEGTTDALIGIRMAQASDGGRLADHAAELHRDLRTAGIHHTNTMEVVRRLWRDQEDLGRTMSRQAAAQEHQALKAAALSEMSNMALNRRSDATTAIDGTCSVMQRALGGIASAIALGKAASDATASINECVVAKRNVVTLLTDAYRQSSTMGHLMNTVLPQLETRCAKSMEDRLAVNARWNALSQVPIGEAAAADATLKQRRDELEAMKQAVADHAERVAKSTQLQSEVGDRLISAQAAADSTAAAQRQASDEKAAAQQAHEAATSEYQVAVEAKQVAEGENHAALFEQRSTAQADDAALDAVRERLAAASRRRTECAHEALYEELRSPALAHLAATALATIQESSKKSDDAERATEEELARVATVEKTLGCMHERHDLAVEETRTRHDVADMEAEARQMHHAIHTLTMEVFASAARTAREEQMRRRLIVKRIEEEQNALKAAQEAEEPTLPIGKRAREASTPEKNRKAMPLEVLKERSPPQLPRQTDEADQAAARSSGKRRTATRKPKQAAQQQQEQPVAEDRPPAEPVPTPARSGNAGARPAQPAKAHAATTATRANQRQPATPGTAARPQRPPILHMAPLETPQRPTAVTTAKQPPTATRMMMPPSIEMGASAAPFHPTPSPDPRPPQPDHRMPLQMPTSGIVASMMQRLQQRMHPTQGNTQQPLQQQQARQPNLRAAQSDAGKRLRRAMEDDGEDLLADLY